MEKVKGFLEQKKWIRLLSMALAACAIIFVLFMFLQKIEMGDNLNYFKLGVVLVCFISQLVLSVLLLGVCIYNILAKNDRDIFLLVVGGIALLSTFFLLKNYDFVAMVKMNFSDDVMDMINAWDLKFSLDQISLVSYANIGAGFYSTVLFFAAKSSKSTAKAISPIAEEATSINATDSTTTSVTTTPVTNEEISNEAIVETLHTGATKAKALTSKTVAFLKTKKGKNTLVGIVAAIVLLFVGSFIYGKMTMTKIDLTGDLEIVFKGGDGNGSVPFESLQTDDIKYDKDDEDIQRFMNTVAIVATPDEGLSNGDKVMIAVAYDEDVAEALNIKISNPEREVEVKGLNALYKSAKDVPAAVIAKTDKLAQSEIESIQSNQFTSLEKMENFKVLSAKPIAKYFTMEYDKPNPLGDDIQYLYNLKIEGDIDDKKEIINAFYWVTINQVNEDIDANSVFRRTGIPVSDDSYNNVKTEEEAYFQLEKYLNSKYEYVEKFK
ncbi:MAG: hypothetical protein RR929_03565 [Erysipelotrichaceae bacterium]